VASTEHVWALHDSTGERHRAGLLLAAFAGLRLAEVCGLRVADIDFMRGIVNPAVQYPADPLKTEISRTAIPIPESLALTLSAHVATYAAGGWLLTDDAGHQLGP
jgi:integrase